jgi:hypothetical protein
MSDKILLHHRKIHQSSNFTFELLVIDSIILNPPFLFKSLIIQSGVISCEEHTRLNMLVTIPDQL